MKLLRPISYVLGLGALLLLALATPATSEGYGDPAIVTDGDGTTVVQPGEPFSVSFSSNVECSWSARFNGDTAPGAIGFDYTATFDAPTDPGTYEGTVVCRYSTAGPFRPIAYSADATQAAARDQVTTQTFTVVVDGDAAAGDDEGAGDDSAASADNGALADTGGSNWELLALGAGLVVIGGGVAVAARRRKSA
ncbi:LPXTG cell wall anchor domain-containing protein [Aeromicrobium choanae]|uniref:LPXTG cell wall anchor domain-containing protein n=1 Tax=Aeromicrobium choanae TaxID=1736691 RepID=UPI0015607E3C|nr:LPXTG cell wall anchor domain-containing protein [Aeromicrobium choanae]